VRVIGTAGHVDHGKSSLVHALTGINPDRLKEEREREMTIDLGFAWMTLPSGERVGIVDVPGHKDFVKNMLAGVGGIDAAVFVVAADEGVMPQTREHLSILDLLQVRGGVVAMTKVDAVADPDWLDLVEADLLDVLEGTVLQRAPVVRCSSRTRQGLDTLVAEIDRCLAGSPPRRDVGRPRLPIDRVFTIAGFGTVVTGTLSDGSLGTGQEVEVQPSGLRARIRGLQTHKQKVEVAVPGSRAAVNLTGVSKEDVRRGEVLTVPGWLRPTTLVDCQLRYLPDALQLLKHDMAVDFFSGAAEVSARVRLLGQKSLSPGEVGWVQIQLAEPVALVKGDRFILRQPSPSVTIGGGVVVNPFPGRRHPRFRPEVLAQLETLAHGTPEEILLQNLERRQPCEAQDLLSRSSLARQQARASLLALVQEGQIVVLGQHGGAGGPAAVPEPAFVVSRSGWGALRERIETLLDDYHRRFPLRAGMPREEVKSRLAPYVPDLTPRLFNDLVGRAVEEAWLAEAAGTLRLASHQAAFTPRQQQNVDLLFYTFRQNPYTTPSVAQAEEMVGSDVLSALLEQGRLVKLNDEVLFLAETYEQMRNQVVAFLKAHERITVAQVRDLFGASRKYALALVGYLDEQRITRRVGDERVLRSNLPPAAPAVSAANPAGGTEGG
jgi:selenocysteine-specific elongation factor